MGESLLVGFRAAVRLPLLEAVVTSSDGLVTSLVGISSLPRLSINELCRAGAVLTAVLVAGVVVRPGLVIGVVLRADLIAGVFVPAKAVGSLLAGLRAAFLEAVVMLSEGLVTSLTGLSSLLRSSINKHLGADAFFTAVLVAGVFLSATVVDFPAVLLVGFGAGVLDFVVAFDLLVRAFPSPRLTGSVLK